MLGILNFMDCQIYAEHFVATPAKWLLGEALPLAKLNALAGKWLKKGSLTEYSLIFSYLCPLSGKRIHFYTKHKTYFYFLINQMGSTSDIESFLRNNIMLTFVSSQNLNIRVRLEAWQTPRKVSVDH